MRVLASAYCGMKIWVTTHLWRFAPNLPPIPSPFPPTPRPPTPPIEVLPPVVLIPEERPGAMFVAWSVLDVLVLICVDVLGVGWSDSSKATKSELKSGGHLVTWIWQVNTSVAIVTSPAQREGAMEGSAQVFAPQAILDIPMSAIRVLERDVDRLLAGGK